WMLDSLEKIGFKYDSSISVNSLYNKTDSSLKGVSSYPYHPKRNGLEIGEEKFVEFPWAYWNVFGFKFNFNFKIPTSGGPMLRLFINGDQGRRGVFQERIIFDNRTQMNADNQDFEYFDGLVDGGAHYTLLSSL
ncbi:hypothetical protein C5S29_03445, partial [ANME-1 cluster archaeon GoMg3.2]|nr:hypothetical protein [ANME-1 cluster archaeon GoMg3.2]